MITKIIIYLFDETAEESNISIVIGYLYIIVFLLFLMIDMIDY